MKTHRRVSATFPDASGRCGREPPFTAVRPVSPSVNRPVRLTLLIPFMPTDSCHPISPKRSRSRWGNFLCGALLLATNWLSAAPRPGDVFREYHLVGGGSNGAAGAEWADEFVFISHHTGERSTVGDRLLEGIDLEHAIRAEFVASYWGGHIGSEKRSVVFNDYPPIELPLIEHAPTSPECYFSQQCQAACEVPLDYLEPGTNRFRMEVGDQICYSFNWGWFWTNQVVLRVYYEPSEVDHPKGAIIEPLPGATLTNYSKVACDIEHGDIDRVEFVGYYDDFSWGGSGNFRDWHGIFWMKETTLQRHVGTASGLYPYLHWENRWIPDQENIRLAARLVGKSGLIYMTEAVEDLRLSHGKRLVRMYSSRDIPEAFATQTGTAECTIEVPDDLTQAFAARLVLSTFSGGTADRVVSLNGTPLVEGGWGRWHRLAFCEEAVPLEILKEGTNTFQIRANQPGEHAFEVNWPGPVLFIEYKSDNP